MDLISSQVNINLKFLYFFKKKERNVTVYLSMEL